jgi:hypothetical protein
LFFLFLEWGYPEFLSISKASMLTGAVSNRGHPASLKGSFYAVLFAQTGKDNPSYPIAPLTSLETWRLFKKLSVF